MVTLNEALMHYKNPLILDALVSASINKEIVGSFNNKGFAKRPDTIQYPQDILELVKQGVTSFHASEELWKNPLLLRPEIPKKELNSLRKGWDLILDIDCKSLDLSQIAAHLLMEALKHNGIHSFSCKFSGNHGFHIGIPFESFPQNVLGNPVEILFPEAPKKIAIYLMDVIRANLSEMILNKYSLEQVAYMVKKSTSDLKNQGQFDPFLALEIDTVLLSSRHLYRMEYSFNEKSGLISIPLAPNDVLSFRKELAKPSQITHVRAKFLDRSLCVLGEATRLILNAYDHKPIVTYAWSEKINAKRKFEKIEQAIPEEYFPSCMKLLLEGLEDGKKRAIFVIIGFLRSAGWSNGMIEDRVHQWNSINREPLREVYVKQQLKHGLMGEIILPPNCNNDAYYKDLRVKCADSVCGRNKNPISHAKRVMYTINRKNAKKPRLTDAQKEMRRKHRENVKKNKNLKPDSEMHT